jgi:phage terminase large subunit GpA-like protein
MKRSARDVYLDAFSNGLKPDPDLTVWEWADAYRVLSSKSAAEPGRWRTSRTPYLREIMECLSPFSEVEEVVFIKGAQVGGTECGLNWLGFIVDAAPAPVLYVSPTVDMAKRASKQRLDPLILETPRLKEKVRDPRSRDSGNTMLLKEFPGGVLVLTGANSSVGLRSLPAKNVFLDEVDAYPGDVDGEGDPVLLAKARARTFARRKVFLVSTPTISGASRIESAFEESDKRRFFVPCPHCGQYQALVWSQVRWEKKDPRTAVYVCEHCREEIEERHKPSMLEKGRWIAENPGAGGGKVAGFHLSSLYSPLGWFSWAEAAKLWLEAHKRPEMLRGFVNTILGETWQERGEAPDWKRLYERRNVYEPNTVPRGGMFLTAGVDVQKDRLALEVVAWGRDKRSWSIDYRHIPGDTTNTGPTGPWARLSQVLDEQFQHENGSLLPIRLTAIDSGFNTQTVYDFVRRYPANRVIATKGFDNLNVLVGTPKIVEIDSRGTKRRRGGKVWPIGVNVLKSELYAWLKLEKPTDSEALETGFPPGWLEFPQYGEQYFQELTAEELVIRKVRGYNRPTWIKVGAQNEALDCRIMARACAAIVGIDRFSDAQWIELEKNLAPSVMVTGQKPVHAAVQGEIPRRKSTFW